MPQHSHKCVCMRETGTAPHSRGLTAIFIARPLSLYMYVCMYPLPRWHAYFTYIHHASGYVLYRLTVMCGSILCYGIVGLVGAWCVSGMVHVSYHDQSTVSEEWLSEWVSAVFLFEWAHCDPSKICKRGLQTWFANKICKRRLQAQLTPHS